MNYEERRRFKDKKWWRRRLFLYVIVTRNSKTNSIETFLGKKVARSLPIHSRSVALDIESFPLVNSLPLTVLTIILDSSKV